MSEMIERVADAILKDLRYRKGFGQIWDECDEGIQAEIREAIGRAAILAMREPSEVMFKARFELYMTSNPWIEANKKSLYQAWIDAALKD